ncbi:MAG: hypothetical protein BWX92_03311 [Deltaproteobacteria bacterium ADurb.Bin135]|nr:MAG: hypothetical protein BWX92_03311 [Deltaproteobacteria bacterium ADurb.Bin135]
MSFKAAKCPNCAGDLQVPEDRDSVKCMYCGSDIIVREAIKAAAASVNIENLFSLAKSAFDAGNFQEACDYYTRILEADVNNYEAWLGKGLSAGWLSSIQNYRIPEATQGLLKAIECSPEDKKEEINARGLGLILNLITTYYSHLKSYAENAISQIEQPLTHPQYKVDVINEVGDNYYKRLRDIVSELDVLSVVSLGDGKQEIGKLIISLCQEGINYSKLKPMENEISYFKQFINDHVTEIKKANPSYEYKEVKPDSNCFIATATMGNANHPIVVLLREFRDSWLLERKHGRMFIKFYYKHGPYLAMIINKYQYLQRISYQVIIRPSAYLAKLLLRK